MNKKILDTNIIIRFLTRDNLVLTEKAEKIFKNAKKKQLVIPDFILTEIVWVLLSFYELKKNKVVEKLEGMLSFDKFDLNRQVLKKAIDVYRNNNIFFVDAYLWVLSQSKNCKLVTFDKRLAALNK